MHPQSETEFICGVHCIVIGLRARFNLLIGLLGQRVYIFYVIHQMSD